MSAREEILAAADMIFGERGFDAASTREIAEHCGVNKALIHYHFKSKEGLLSEVLHRYYERLGEEVRGALTSEGSPRERLALLVDVYSDFLGQNQRFCRIVQREATGGQNVGLIRERMAPLFELGSRLLAESFPATEGGPLAAPHLMVSVYGMIVTYFTYGDVLEDLIGSDPMSAQNLEARKQHIHRVIDVLFTAIDGDENT